MYLLRKSYGPWSAGTPIDIVENIGEWATGPKLEVKEMVTVKTRSRASTVFDVALDDIVERKDKMIVVAKNRRERRLSDPTVIAKRIAFENR